MKVLILGKIPPPIGGVTIHVQRLIQSLDKYKIDYSFFSLSYSLKSIIKESIKFEVIHLHSSNAYFRFLYSIFCYLLHKKLIQTYHGDLGRFNIISNFFDWMSIFFTHIPIVINNSSYKKAIKINRNTIQISAYFKPIISESLDDEIIKPLNAWKMGFSQIFCTNASCVAFDKYGREIYGGTNLIKVFKEIPHKGLIFSDPTGMYKELWDSKYGEVPKNVFFIDKVHNFIEIIKISTCYIRATTTDGDSLSVKEALSYGKTVLASDCIERPNSCIVFKTNDFNDLFDKLLNFKKINTIKKNKYEGINEIIKLYKSKSIGQVQNEFL